MVCPICREPHPEGAPCHRASATGSGVTVRIGSPSQPSLPDVAVPLVDPLVGSTVGSFRVVRLLGRGGMGSVYLAEHPAIGSRVAIKFLHESMSASAELVGRFYDEARAVNLVGHENIVGIYDLGLLHSGRYFIVMEYLEGDTLAARLRRGLLPLRVALDVLLQLCDALQAAHERGVVHRDLKPDNVFLLRRRGKDHFAKLVDFGIAKLRDAPGGASRTAAGVVVGTPEYMSPEQCENQPVDARADVYALGVMAYQLVAGRLPFQGNSIARLVLAHLQERPPPPRSFNPAIPASLEAAILRAMEKRPGDRFESASAFAAALSSVLDELSRSSAEGASPAPAGAPVPPPPAPAERLEVEVRAPGEPPRRLVASDLSRGGMHLHAEGRLPPLFGRLGVSLPRASGQPPLEVEAEVVRHVTPVDAASWGMPPGFAVQFVGLGAAQRAALERLAGSARRGPDRDEAADDAAQQLVADLRARAEGSHYEFLGVSPDADFADVRSRAKDLRSQLQALLRRRQSSDQERGVGALLERVERALSVVGVPGERLVYDARRGNHAGVARCVATGIPDAVVEARRRELLAERAGAEEEGQRQLARARVARAMRNEPAALAALEAALAADPLNLAIHQAYWTLRRETASG